MAGLVPAIHVEPRRCPDKPEAAPNVDGRDKPGHDGVKRSLVEEETLLPVGTSSGRRRIEDEMGVEASSSL
jgi:hypothetical protein